ncbi:MAG: cupin domain-containing protein [Caldisericia bacterium]|nr:cupin domain-containing protein [Caldisericia bacterium]
MIEVISTCTYEKTKTIENLVDDDHTMINHIILPKEHSISSHLSNSNTYLIVVKGRLTLTLNEQDPHKYTAGQIIAIPYKTQMSVDNVDEELLEFFVVKSPNPSNYKA